MKTFVISLPRSLERRAAVTAQFTKMSLPFRFFDAIDGNASAAMHFLRFDAHTYRLNTYRAPSPGEIACYASHLALWKYCARTNEPIIVLEDDCRLEAHFPAAVNATAHLIDRFGFIRLQFSIRNRRLRFSKSAHRLMTMQGFELQYLARVPLCLTGYAIAPRTAARLAAQSATLDAPVDKFLQRTWQHGEANFALAPASVSLSPLANTSTIGDRDVPTRAAATMLARAHYKLRGALARREFNRSQLSALSKEFSDAAGPSRAGSPAEPDRRFA